VKQRATHLAVRSQASRKAWKSRKRMARARSEPSAAPVGETKRAVGYAAILAATSPLKSSRDVAQELGVSAAYVRKVWSRTNQPKRSKGVRPHADANSV